MHHSHSRAKAGDPTDKLKMNVRVNLDLLEDMPKRKDGRGRPRKERASEQFTQQIVTPVQPVAAPAVRPLYRS